MALTAKLQIGNNANGNYTKTYLLTDFHCHLTRRHNGERPDGPARCDTLAFTVVAPGKTDRELEEWFVKRTSKDGRLLAEMSDGSTKQILFTQAVCFSLSDEYHIDRQECRILKLCITAPGIVIDTVSI